MGDVRTTHDSILLVRPLRVIPAPAKPRERQTNASQTWRQCSYQSAESPNQRFCSPWNSCAVTRIRVRPNEFRNGDIPFMPLLSWGSWYAKAQLCKKTQVPKCSRSPQHGASVDGRQQPQQCDKTMATPGLEDFTLKRLNTGRRQARHDTGTQPSPAQRKAWHLEKARRVERANGIMLQTI